MKYWIALTIILSATCTAMAADGWFPGPEHTADSAGYSSSIL